MNPRAAPGHRALLILLGPIVRWCVRMGVGYGQLIRMVKPLFFEAAFDEINKSGGKCTDSSLSLASGLHKRDVALFWAAYKSPGDPEHDGWLDVVAQAQSWVEHINPASQVIARWLATGWPDTVPVRGRGQTFDALTKACQQEGMATLSTRLVLQDLARRGLVQVQSGKVTLLSPVGAPNIDAQEAVVHFVGAVRDHMESCLANLEAGAQGRMPRHLEQSIQADGLHPESVASISSAARQWWQQALQSITAQAILLSEQDEPAGGDQRLRLGVYFYTQAMAPQSPKPSE